jgi:putative NIF3 family GTP cyclohydrolase 1 type 2
VNEGAEELRKIGGFKTPVIHPSSKQIVLYEHEKAELPRNLILMGDIIADSCMARDNKHEHVLKVGFFNGHGKVTLEEFSKHFDVVITGDGTLCPIVRTI